jgi:hypothetical protein
MAAQKLPNKNTAPQKEGASDQVAEDIKKFKSAKAKFTEKLKSNIAPNISNKVPVVHTTKASLSSVTSKIFDPELIKRVVKIVVLVFLLLGLFYIVTRIFTIFVEDGTDETDGVAPTPSIGEFRPYKPSVYAEDELILKLDEDVKVIDRELSTTQLKEAILNPPNLDFDINFEED